MFSTKLLTLLLCALIFFVSSSPVSCKSGSNDMGSLLEVDILSSGCEDRDVCSVQCSRFVSGCTKEIYFGNFMDNIPSYHQATVAKAYVDACIDRKYDNPADFFWMRQKLVNTYTDSQKSLNLPPVSVGYGMPFVNVVQNMVNSGVPVYIYLARISELFLTLEKICNKRPDWRQYLGQKLTGMLDSDFSDFEREFASVPALLPLLRQRFKQAQAAKNSYMSSGAADYQKQRFEMIVNGFRWGFRQRVGGNAAKYLCKCESLIQSPGFSSVFPSAFGTAGEECRKTCSRGSRRSLEVDQAEEEEEEEEFE
jgi:hypothetical protein